MAFSFLNASLFIRTQYTSRPCHVCSLALGTCAISIVIFHCNESVHCFLFKVVTNAIFPLNNSGYYDFFFILNKTVTILKRHVKENNLAKEPVGDKHVVHWLLKFRELFTD